MEDMVLNPETQTTTNVWRVLVFAMQCRGQTANGGTSVRGEISRSVVGESRGSLA